MEKKIVRAAEWAERVKAWRSSGQSKTEWCQINGIGYKSFLRWEKQLRDEGDARVKQRQQQAPTFVALPSMAASKEAAAAKLVVHLEKGRLSIEVPEAYNPNALIALVETLRPLC